MREGGYCGISENLSEKSLAKKLSCLMLPTQTTSIVLYKTFEANVNFKPGASFNVFQLNDLYKVLLSLSLG